MTGCFWWCHAITWLDVFLTSWYIDDIAVSQLTKAKRYVLRWCMCDTAIINLSLVCHVIGWFLINCPTIARLSGTLLPHSCFLSFLQYALWLQLLHVMSFWPRETKKCVSVARHRQMTAHLSPSHGRRTKGHVSTWSWTHVSPSLPHSW